MYIVNFLKWDRQRCVDVGRPERSIVSLKKTVERSTYTNLFVDKIINVCKPTTISG